MSLRYGEIFADAGSMWRGERALLMPVAGVFFFLPMLGIVLLVTASGIARDMEPEQFREALLAFQTANFVPILFAGIVLDFGTFAVLNLFLQGGGRTLGDVLRLAALRFLPFLLISFIASMAMSLGLSLFVLPGLFVFARTWLAAPAYAAMPERGILSAFREGWRRSGGATWLVILAAGMLVLLPALFAATLAASLVTGLAAMAGAGEAGAIAGNVLIAAVGAMLWSWLAVLRAVFYRAPDASTGM